MLETTTSEAVCSRRQRKSTIRAGQLVCMANGCSATVALRGLGECTPLSAPVQSQYPFLACFPCVTTTMAAAAPSPAQQAGDAEDLVVLNETERVTKAEFATIMGVNKDWPYPAHVDPWCVVHEAITKDMKDTASALASIMAGLKAGKPLEAWQVSNLQKYVPVFIDFVHHHHDSEEKIFFPWINTRTNLGERMAADHKTLMVMLDKIEAGTKGLNVTGNADTDMKAIEAIKQVMDEMLPLMTEHFKEEEQRGLPLLRKHFTHKELRVVEEKIKATFTTKDMAHLLNPMLKPEEKRKFMSQLGVPGLIQSLVMMPACKKYQKKVQRLVEELQAGERTKPTGCFA